MPTEDQKATIRALCQEAVHHFTDLRRQELRHQNPGLSEEELDQMQPLIDEYDPVVQLAILGSDHSKEASLRRQANSDAAQYLRPKLKSVEMLGDPRLAESQAQKDELASKLVGVMELMAKAKSQTD